MKSIEMPLICHNILDSAPNITVWDANRVFDGGDKGSMHTVETAQ
jgi:hypothetical protein